ncbi:hypothetical protein ZIOFF_030759 [Zingiber officinale]|uniref:Uncharacterized protein n=1 Tax=Zingiber officinale TaxID=94328 RepID=A0A8J5H0C4_ZINOF|nr:hypothetical protein ZIOFF_030759 [Zingiber officinale]
MSLLDRRLASLRSSLSSPVVFVAAGCHCYRRPETMGLCLQLSRAHKTKGQSFLILSSKSNSDVLFALFGNPRKASLFNNIEVDMKIKTWTHMGAYLNDGLQRAFSTGTIGSRALDLDERKGQWSAASSLKEKGGKEKTRQGLKEVKRKKWRNSEACVATSLQRLCLCSQVTTVSLRFAAARQWLSLWGTSFSNELAVAWQRL